MFEIKPSSRFVLKKRCLFVVLVITLFIILVNVGITALLLYYINVSKQSVGEIRLNHEQTLINGKLFVNKNIVTEKVLAVNNTMHFISQDHIFIESNSGVSGNRGSIFIDKDRTSIQADAISFKGSDGIKYLYVSRENMEANIRLLNLNGKARSIPSIQSEAILSSPLSDLRISSPTRNAEITSAKALRLNSFGGRIDVDSLNDIIFDASKIVFNSNEIYVPNVLGGSRRSKVGRPTLQSRNFRAYEICVCGNNKKVFASNDGCLTPVRMDQSSKSIEEVCS